MLGYCRVTCKKCHTVYSRYPKEKTLCPNCKAPYEPFTRAEAIAYKETQSANYFIKKTAGDFSGK